MDEETNRIRQHIDTEREQLGENLDEIEYRVKSATDLRAHFNKNTGMILGAAVASGFLLSLAFRKSSTSDNKQSGESPSTTERSASTAQPATRASRHVQHFSETLDGIVEGIVGVASDRLRSFVAEVIPGFQAQYDAIDRHPDRSSVHAMRSDLGSHGGFSAAK